MGQWEESLRAPRGSFSITLGTLPICTLGWLGAMAPGEVTSALGCGSGLGGHTLTLTFSSQLLGPLPA